MSESMRRARWFGCYYARFFSPVKLILGIFPASFRRFIAARSDKPSEQLDHTDVRQWLSDLAVKERVAVATQSQTLNLSSPLISKNPSKTAFFAKNVIK